MVKLEMIEDARDDAIAAWFAGRLRAALAQSPEIAVTVPGGSTPFPIFDLLAKEDLPWQRISVWPGDDRIVEEDHPASNVGKIRARLEPAGAPIVDPLPPEAPFDRLSLTIPSLTDSDEIMFVIRGADKRAVFDAAVQGENDLPIARLLKAARHKVTCFC